MLSILTPLDLANAIFDIDALVEDELSKRKEQFIASQVGVCRFFQKGQCAKGKACPFRHAKGDKSVVCKHWLRGLCKKNDECEFLHVMDRTKMPPCHFYVNFGKCSNSECPYLHIKPEDRIRDCPWYDRGFCKHGPDCNNRHVRRAVCPDYLAGLCMKGPDCDYGHPKFELPPEATGGKKTEFMCTNCGHPGHTTTMCTDRNRDRFGGLNDGKRRYKTPLSEVTCFKCSEKGHYANHCPNPKKSGADRSNRISRDDKGGGPNQNRNQDHHNTYSKHPQHQNENRPHHHNNRHQHQNQNHNNSQQGGNPDDQNSNPFPQQHNHNAPQLNNNQNQS